MPASDFPIILQTLAETPRRERSFMGAISTLEAGRAAGALPNARYLEAKDDVSRSLEIGWNRSVREPFLWNRSHEMSAEERTALYAFDGSPLPHTLNTFRKRCNAVPEGAAKTAIAAFLDEIEPLCALVTACKGLAVKKIPAPDAPDPVAKYQAPNAPPSAMKMVHDLLKSITEGARSSIEDRIYNRFTQMLAGFVAAEANNASAGIKRLRDHSPLEWLRLKQSPVDPRDQAILSACLERRFDPIDRIYRYDQRQNLDSMLRKEAVRMSHDICASFISKNVQKLDSIVSSRGDFSGIQEIGRGVTPEAMEGRLRLSFEDGASFEARTSVVFSRSIYGKGFLRFPLTFHNVILGDGSPMPGPSEKSMNEDFVAAKRSSQTFSL